MLREIGATELLAAPIGTVGDRLGVKASGGMRDHAMALAMIEAGASRLGMSGSRAVLEGCPD